MEELRKFLRVKSKSEYQTDRGRIKITKKDRTKIKKFKTNRAIGRFELERPNVTTFICQLREEPLPEGPKPPLTASQQKKQAERLERFVAKQLKKQARRSDQPAVEDVEDLWAGREGPSEEQDRKLSRRTPKPKFAEVYSEPAARLRTTREDIWKSVHFYRDTLRRPRMYRSELDKLVRRLDKVTVKVPEGLQLPETEHRTLKYRENLRDVQYFLAGVYALGVHSSSLSLTDVSGHLPVRTLRLVLGGADVLIRRVHVSPDEQKLAVLTYERGIVLLPSAALVDQAVVEQTVDLETSGVGYRLFPDQTFRSGAWHPKSTYFAGVVHGQVVVVNTKQKRGLVFYKGDQKIQQVEFHPSKAIIVLMAPSNIFFYSLKDRKKLSKQTVNNVSAVNTVALSLDKGVMYVGTGSSQVQIFSVDRQFKAEFIKSIYTRDIPRRIVFHEHYGYAAVLSRTPTFVVYANIPRNDLPSSERAGAIHKYPQVYRAGVFHPQHSTAWFTLSNQLSMLGQAGRPEGSHGAPPLPETR